MVRYMISVTLTVSDGKKDNSTNTYIRHRA